MGNLLLLGWLGGQEILIIVLIILLLFGARKIPQLMRGMGSGINEFKKGMSDGEGDGEKDQKTPSKSE